MEKRETTEQTDRTPEEVTSASQKCPDAPRKLPEKREIFLETPDNKVKRRLFVDHDGMNRETKDKQLKRK